MEVLTINAFLVLPVANFLTALVLTTNVPIFITNQIVVTFSVEVPLLQYKCDETCMSCSGPSHKDCASCFRNSTLTSDGLCLNCLSGQFLDAKTSKCESCHMSCSTCSGPTASDCLSCRTPYALDNSRCVSCCLLDLNDIKGVTQELNDCCYCVSSGSVCLSSVAIDRTRS
ncbi:unnamed protein product, partial [Oppiella nova]